MPKKAISSTSAGTIEMRVPGAETFEGRARIAAAIKRQDAAIFEVASTLKDHEDLLTSILDALARGEAIEPDHYGDLAKPGSRVSEFEEAAGQIRDAMREWAEASRSLIAASAG